MEPRCGGVGVAAGCTGFAAALALGLVLVAMLTLASGIVSWRLRQDVTATTTRVEDARLERSVISDTAARETATASDAAARALKEATEHAEQARPISVVLAAPDVVRYDLIGRDSLAGAIAQLRWSRSRGLVFSGSRVSLPPADNRYQVWLLTRAGPVKTAAFVPDDTGVVTIAVPFPETAGPVIGAMVTTEPAAGSDMPTGTAVSPVLTRIARCRFSSRRSRLIERLVLVGRRCPTPERSHVPHL